MKWAPVWTDEGMLQVVLNNNATAIESLREQLNQGTVRVRIPFLEYATGNPKKADNLPFTREVDLANALEIQNIETICSKLDKMVNFVPFVAYFEGTINMFVSVSRWIREEINYLMKMNKLGSEVKHQLAEMRNYSDEELEYAFSQGTYDTAIAERGIISMRKYRDLLKNDFPTIDHLIARDVLSKKPTFLSRFKGREYFTYLAGKEKELNKFYILFPVEAINDLPNLANFEARIIGIMFYNANPPQAGLSHLALVAVSLFLPWR